MSSEQKKSIRAWRWILILVSLACYVHFSVQVPWSHRHNNDFKHIYLGMQALYDESEPYSLVSLRLQAALHGLRGTSLNPYVYLPFTGLTFGFLKPLPFPAASMTWFILNQAFTILALALMTRTLWPRSSLVAFFVLLLCLGFHYPLVRTLTAGQLNCALLVMLTAAFSLLCAGREKSAGALLGVAALYKLFPGLLGLYLLAFRRWRALGTMIMTGVVLMGISILSVGVRVHLAFLPMLRQMGYGHSTWAKYGQAFWRDPANQSLNSLFSHLMVPVEGMTPWIASTQRMANAATIVCVVILSALWAAGCLRGFQDRDSTGNGLPEERREAGFQATLLLALLIPSIMWDHYLLLTILPTAWLWKETLARRQWVRFGLTCAAQIVISMPWRFDAPSFLHGPLVPLMSVKLFPTLLLFFLTLLPLIFPSEQGVITNNDMGNSRNGEGRIHDETVPGVS